MRPLHPFDIPLTGINLVEASAGTGKTYNISSLYIRALTEYEKKVSEILVVTYTEAATKELKDRLQKRIRESIAALSEGEAPAGDEFLHELVGRTADRERAIDRLRQAVHSFDEASVYTIHGFCYRALQEHAFESGTIFGAELIGDDTEVVLDVVDDYWRSWVNEASANPLKHPLLKLLSDKNYSPARLTGELAPFIGKPYLKVLPEEDPVGEADEELRELNRLYEELQAQWNEDREEIFSLLNAGHLRYYRTTWLEGWMRQMDDWLQGDTPPVRLFDKFEKFVQSEIDNTPLKKASEKKGVPHPQHPFFHTTETYRQTAETLQQFDVSFKRDLLAYLQQTLDSKKDELQVLSFDDLLLKLNSALDDPDRGKRLAAVLRYKYPVALVDEFQDTDPIQYNIFRNIYGKLRREGNALFMIGDPKQSIYSFRGADIFAYLQAKQDADEDRVFSLNKNFRSVPGILQGVETLFGRHPNPFLLKDIAFEPVQPGREEYNQLTVNGTTAAPVCIRELSPPRKGDKPLTKGEAEELIAEDTASEIVSLIEQGKKGEMRIGEEPVKAKNIAVLVRTHKQADIISQALQRRNVKSVQYSQQSVFQSVEAEELERVMRAIAEPVNETRIKSALATRLMGYGARDLLRLEEDESEWIRILNRFADWHYAWQEHGFAFMFRAWLQDSKAFWHIIGYEEGERMLTNVRHLSELIQAEEQENQRGARGLIRWLSRKRKENDLMLESEQLRLESDEELVKVVTMHRSKGLQYPIVFCPFLWHGPEFPDRGQPLVYHDGEDQNQTFLDLQGKHNPERTGRRLNAAREELAESVRLAYVALTRAEQRCYISWAQAGKSECSPFGYLILPPETTGQALETIIGNGTYQPLDPSVFREALEALVEAGGGSIGLTTVTEVDTERKNKQDTDHPEYYHKKFTRSAGMEPRYGITSFSSLMRSREDAEESQAYEQYFDEAYTGPVSVEESAGQNIFTFPRGPQPGTCIHKIFEEIEFHDLSGVQPAIEENLSLYNIDTDWKDVVEAMLHTVTAAPLLEEMPGLRLSALRPEDLISELEFYYRMESVDMRGLFSIVRGAPPGREVPSETRMRGFMKGFIDLTFRYRGKFYILDYKTNYLGDTVQDYAPERLREAIAEAAYDMQYHIYTLALHRYLGQRVKHYDYEQHFGGVFYLFVRGMNEDGREGIFRGRPPAERIEALDKYIKEGTGNGA